MIQTRILQHINYSLSRINIDDLLLLKKGKIGIKKL